MADLLAMENLLAVPFGAGIIFSILAHPLYKM